MYKRKVIFSLFVLAVMLALLPAARARQQAAKPDEEQKPAAIAVAPSLSELLPARLAGVKATGEIRQFGRENLAGLVADSAPAFQEYRVVSALSRQYGPARVDLFISEDRFAAFGLFTYLARKDGARPASQQIGTEGATLADETIFYKGNYFVRVINSSPQKGAPLRSSLAQAVAASIKYEGEADPRPPLLASLPREFIANHSERYFLGPASIKAYVEDGGEMIGFAGDAEAVMADYRKGDAGSAGPVVPSLSLIIVEYHTPAFATEAFGRVNDYISSLPEAEQARFMVRREGNYIVQAVKIEDREFAEQVMGAVEYPYTVKWLRNPLLPTNDPFRQRKAAEMLVSTFGILGVILMTVLVVGGTFGTVIFLKRRKRQQEIFSDAGGMLRLELDPFEAVITQGSQRPLLGPGARE
ncbi:MAG TPA: DUF6599 family protein [Blastocatellia bacterium]|nr:DUF6599 family protein [Blastocatellia bacterium]